MKNHKHPLPNRDPIGGGPLVVTELLAEETGVTIRGTFEVPVYSMLDAEQSKFLETFLRCRGMLSGVERELGISYPTVRSRLDALLDALGFVPFKDPKDGKAEAKKLQVLEALEKGEITADEAKAKLRGGA